MIRHLFVGHAIAVVFDRNVIPVRDDVNVLSLRIVGVGNQLGQHIVDVRIQARPQQLEDAGIN